MNPYSFVIRSWRKHVAIQLLAIANGREPYAHIQDKV
jgi:hypothetical protein